jgi:TRAP-type C4-dicarboxylate transport system permease small subunit
MKILERIFDVIEQGLGVAFLLTMFVSVLIQIFFRYVLKTPLTWTEEASRYSFIWTVLLGAAFAVRRREHVVMDVLFKKFPAPHDDPHSYKSYQCNETGRGKENVSPSMIRRKG